MDLLNEYKIHDLTGVEIRTCQSLSGMKKAVRLGGIVHVSPAMWDLMNHAVGEELERLLSAIEVVDMDAPTWAEHFHAGQGIRFKHEGA